MPQYLYNTIMGMSCSLSLVAVGFSMLNDSWGKIVGAIILLISAIIGSGTFGYQWGYLKGKKEL